MDARQKAGMAGERRRFNLVLAGAELAIALRRALVGFAWLALATGPAAAIVGGAPFADQAIARYVVLIVGAHHLCTGVAIGPDLVLTAAHCVPNGGKYRLMTFEGRRAVVTDVASVAAHPQFSPRADAPDLALVKLGAPAPNLMPVVFSERRTVTASLWRASVWACKGTARSLASCERPRL